MFSSRFLITVFVVVLLEISYRSFFYGPDVLHLNPVDSIRVQKETHTRLTSVAAAWPILFHPLPDFRQRGCWSLLCRLSDTSTAVSAAVIVHIVSLHQLPSVLWHCWLGGRKGIRPVKTLVRYWRGYLSGVRCKWFAYDPADAIATPSSLASLKSRIVYLSNASLPRLS